MKVTNKELLLEFKDIKIYDCKITTSSNLDHNQLLVEKKDYCQILAIDEFANIILVKQFKVGAGIICELPAGHMEIGENPLECITRELLEETGYIANEICFAFTAYTSPGILSNKIHAFIGLGCTKISLPNLDPDEELTIKKIPVSEISKYIGKGILFTDLGTIALIEFYLKKNGKK
jgi:ADP-ribose pyrophosphatase